MSGKFNEFNKFREFNRFLVNYFYRVLGSTRYVGEFIAHKTHKLIKLFIGFVLTCVFTMCKSGCACMRMRSSN